MTPGEAALPCTQAYLREATRFLLHVLSGYSYLAAPTMDSSLFPL